MAKIIVPITANNAVKVRSAVTVADSTTFTDANYDVSATGVVQPQGYRSVALFLRFTGGAGPTAQIQLLHRIAQAVQTGTTGWIVGAQSPVLVPGEAWIVDVMGRDFFPTLLNFTGAPTSIDVWCGGWEAFRQDGPRGA